MSLFGHLRKDRFDVGIEVVIKQEFYDILTPEQFQKTMERVKRFERLLLNCGHNSGLEHQDKMTLAQFIDIQIQKRTLWDHKLKYYVCIPPLSEQISINWPTDPNFKSLTS
mgnify:CR=1 FL=1